MCTHSGVVHVVTKTGFIIYFFVSTQVSRVTRALCASNL